MESSSQPKRTNILSCDEDWSYSISGQRKALIFNHIHFDVLPEDVWRVQAKSDGIKLKQALERLDFNVSYHEDKRRDEILDIINEVKDDIEDYDCLFVTVMTHGYEHGWLYAKDAEYKEEMLLQCFEDVLIGKPKIFLFECGRGNKMFDGNKHSDHSHSNGYKRLKSADFFIIDSTPEGYVSWKGENGSWLIEDFCMQLERNAANKDLAKIMTLVANSMSKRISKSHKESQNGKKQVPVVTSTLRKFLYFRRQM